MTAATTTATLGRVVLWGTDHAPLGTVEPDPTRRGLFSARCSCGWRHTGGVATTALNALHELIGHADDMHDGWAS